MRCWFEIREQCKEECKSSSNQHLIVSAIEGFEMKCLRSVHSLYRWSVLLRRVTLIGEMNEFRHYCFICSSLEWKNSMRKWKRQKKVGNHFCDCFPSFNAYGEMKCARCSFLNEMCQQFTYFFWPFCFKSFSDLLHQNILDFGFDRMKTTVTIPNIWMKQQTPTATSAANGKNENSYTILMNMREHSISILKSQARIIFSKPKTFIRFFTFCCCWHRTDGAIRIQSMFGCAIRNTNIVVRFQR